MRLQFETVDVFTAARFSGNPLTLSKDGAAISGARLASPQLLTIGDQVPVEAVASACGIAADDIETRNHFPCIASCGVGFILAEVKSRTGLAAAMPHIDVFRRDIVNRGTTGILIYTEVDDHDIDIRARMFAPLKGIPEDPATGSANVALIGLLAKLRPESDLHLSKTIAQGVEMGRPSVLQATAEKRGGVVTATFIGGRCVPVMRGEVCDATSTTRESSLVFGALLCPSPEAFAALRLRPLPATAGRG
jgi:trans-2,3-dihydro-3-hydroxyanthranilate isomerase